VTLSDLQWRNGRYFVHLAKIGSFMANCVKVLKARSILSVTEMQPDESTLNHKRGGSTFVIVTLENLDGF